MNERFLRYIGCKSISQTKLSELSGVPRSTVSHFCKGGNIGSENLLRLLNVCDDLSLEWLFYGSGEMLRDSGGVYITNNSGAFAGAEFGRHADEMTILNGTEGKPGKGFGDETIQALLARKDAVIAEKDRVISERDATIAGLLRRLLPEENH